MGQQFNKLSEKHINFIAEQKIFFVGTATADSCVNISPKGMDSLKVLGNNRVVWLNVTGSGNETSAHIQQDPRMTIMFCAFDGSPLILRLYGTAKVIHKNDLEWNELFLLFKPLSGARQIFDLSIDLVQSSCGMAVPCFSYVEDRALLSNWATKKGDDGLKQYWQEKNQISIDGIPTHIVAKMAKFLLNIQYRVRWVKFKPNPKPSPTSSPTQESPFSTVARTTTPQILPTSNETLPFQA